METTRKVKLYSRSRPSQSGMRRLKDVPWLNVSGVWLERAGFGIGDRLTITVREKELVIQPASPEKKFLPDQ